MDKLIFTAIASLSQIKTDQAQSSNELANMSSIGFKKAFDHATETRRVGGAGNPRYVPVNTANDAVMLDQGPSFQRVVVWISTCAGKRCWRSTRPMGRSPLRDAVI